jgi:FKBP-type peptidyl-prolyl cis-trans isomerase FkpA
MRALALPTLVLSAAALVSACQSKTAPPPAADAAPAKVMSEEDKTLYALGVLISQNLKGFQLTSGELESVKQGLTDGVMNQTLKVEADKYRPQVEQLHQTRMAAAGKLEAEAGSAYLEKAAGEKGAVKTDSGLVITELKAGTGASPKPTDQVKVHYQGTLINGKVFDSSIQRGEPATFPLNGVIPCWTEALQRMKVGGKSRVVCPAAIAYGERGAPPDIKPGATLVFDVELLEIMK